VLAGQIFTYDDSSEDRSAASAAFPAENVKPPKRDLRAIYYGLLGPHALSITYATNAGIKTSAVSAGTGAYLIVRRAGHAFHGGVGTAFVGEATAHAVFSEPIGVVSAITYRFGALVCSDGRGVPLSTRCPTPPTLSFVGPLRPARSLHEPVRARPVPQSRESCSRAFLLYPCYRAVVEFTAPYAVTNAGSEYSVMASSSCKNARLSSWGMDRDVKRGETVRTLSTGLFRICASPQRLEVRYEPPARLPRASVIVGVTRVG
jgi:hypothetical protein